MTSDFCLFVSIKREKKRERIFRKIYRIRIQSDTENGNNNDIMIHYENMRKKIVLFYQNINGDST